MSHAAMSQRAKTGPASTHLTSIPNRPPESPALTTPSGMCGHLLERSAKDARAARVGWDVTRRLANAHLLQRALDERRLGNAAVGDTAQQDVRRRPSRSKDSAKMCTSSYPPPTPRRAQCARVQASRLRAVAPVVVAAAAAKDGVAGCTIDTSPTTMPKDMGMMTSARGSTTRCA
jgi:hypothetical protein